MRTSVCIEMIYTELPFLDRIWKAAEAGFDAFEFWGWEDKDLPALVKTAADAQIELLMFQANRKGTMIHPVHQNEVIRGVADSLTVASDLGVRQLFLLTDELGADRSVVHSYQELTEDMKSRSVQECLEQMAGLADAKGITLCLEVLNTRVDHSGYWLNHADLGFDLIRRVNSPNLRLLFDCYHVQIMDGNLIPNIRDNLELIGHVHVADTPGRHEPGTGEINYANVFKALGAAGYAGYVGMEFVPTGESDQSVAEALQMVRASSM
ncbi:MAG: TIM barrel protein [Anaerolineales bacterium]|nr:TIM barrel protein [Anaerolineales bacterium]